MLFDFRKARLFLPMVILLLLAPVALAHAQSGGGYDLAWFTVDGGGGSSRGGSYAVDDTIGQPDAHDWSSGGPYSVQGGFWAGIGQDSYIYLPLILR